VLPGCLVARLIGVLEAKQVEGGKSEQNDRLIAVAAEAHDHTNIKKLRDLNPTLLDELEHFFISYNEARGKTFRVLARRGPAAAQRLVRNSMTGKKMKTANTAKYRGKFQVIVESRDAEAAMMTLGPGAASDEELSNEHPRCEQWTYVIRGTGEALVVPTGKRRRNVQLKTGALLLIEKGERHQIRNTGTRPLVTLTFYVPRAYDQEGELRESAKAN